MNSRIDKKIRRKFQEDNYIPSSTRDAINDVLQQNRNIVINIKPYKPSILKKLVTAMASIIVVFIGSISVYAAFGGTISGKPVLEWIGIKFSDQYEDYKVDVEGQEVVYNETKIDLVSTVCDDGFAIFELDVKLSKQDKEYLRLGEKLVSEQELKEAEIAAKEEEEANPNGFEYTERSRYRTLLEGSNLVNTVKMIINDDLLGPNHAKYNILIDGEGYYTTCHQTVTKISDYEYKVFQLYFLTDELLKGKTNFEVTLRLNAIENVADKSGYSENKSGLHLANIASNKRRIDMTGEVSANVSKDKALENTKVIIPNCAAAKYKNMAKTVEEVKVTPLQIIAKVSTKIEDVSLNSLSSIQNKDHIGIVSFDVYDSNENKLSSHKYETKRTITYANGNVEEWAPGDIGTYKSFYNATMELTEYIIIEKKDDVNEIKIVPKVTDNKYVDGKYEKVETILDAFEIDLENTTN